MVFKQSFKYLKNEKINFIKVIKKIEYLSKKMTKRNIFLENIHFTTFRLFNVSIIKLIINI